jgi:hypothetical protein
MDVSGGSPPLARQDGRRRIAPDIISVLDYEAGFGESELVTFSERDLERASADQSHPWNAVDGIN